jgi:hypothetical protein
MLVERAHESIGMQMINTMDYTFEEDIDIMGINYRINNWLNYRISFWVLGIRSNLQYSCINQG